MGHSRDEQYERIATPRDVGTKGGSIAQMWKQIFLADSPTPVKP